MPLGEVSAAAHGHGAVKTAPYKAPINLSL